MRPHRLVEIEHFFNTYKLLENKAVDIAAGGTAIRARGADGGPRAVPARSGWLSGRDRLFVAVPLPPEPLAACQALIDGVRAGPLGDVPRWVHLDEPPPDRPVPGRDAARPHARRRAGGPRRARGRRRRSTSSSPAPARSPRRASRGRCGWASSRGRRSWARWRTPSTRRWSRWAGRATTARTARTSRSRAWTARRSPPRRSSRTSCAPRRRTGGRRSARTASSCTGATWAAARRATSRSSRSRSPG